MPCKILLTTFLKKKRKKNRYNPMKFLFLLLFIHISKIFIKNLLIESFKGMVNKNNNSSRYIYKTITKLYT